MVPEPGTFKNLERAGKCEYKKHVRMRNNAYAYTVEVYKYTVYSSEFTKNIIVIIPLTCNPMLI